MRYRNKGWGWLGFLLLAVCFIGFGLGGVFAGDVSPGFGDGGVAAFYQGDSPGDAVDADKDVRAPATSCADCHAALTAGVVVSRRTFEGDSPEPPKYTRPRADGVIVQIERPPSAG